MASPDHLLTRDNPEKVRLGITVNGSPGILTGSEWRGTTGAPLLWFVHGFQSERLGNKAWNLFQTAREKGWSFTSFDFRGHGESTPTNMSQPENPLAGLCHSSLVEDMEKISGYLDSWHSGPRILIGSSMGGYAAAWLAALHPSRVQGLVLVAPAWRFGATILGRVEKANPGSTSQWKETGWFDYEGGFGPTRLSWRLIEESEAHPYSLLARRIACPIRVIHGLDDEVIPFSESVEALGNLQVDANLILTRTGGHRLLDQIPLILAEAQKLAIQAEG